MGQGPESIFSLRALILQQPRRYLFATQGAVGQVAAAIFHFFGQQTGRFRAGGFDVFVEVRIRSGQVNQGQNVHILDSNMIFRTNVDCALGPSKLIPSKAPIRASATGITIGGFQAFNQHDSRVHAISIEQVRGNHAVAGLVFSNQKVIGSIVRS